MLEPLLNISADGPEDASHVAEALQLLLAHGGVLDGYGAPIALLGADGVAVSANAAASERPGLFRRGNDLTALVDQVLRSSASATCVVRLHEAEDEETVLEFTAMPMPGSDRVLVIGKDITLDRSLRDALVESRQRYKDLVELSSDFAWETDRDGRFTFVSPRGGLGYQADDLVGHLAEQFLDSGFPMIGASPFRAESAVSDVDVWFRRRNGTSSCLVISAVPVFGSAGTWVGARGTSRDVSEERRRDAALALAETRKQLLAHVIRSVRDEIDPDAMLRAAAVETARALGAAQCLIYRLGTGDMLERAAEFGQDVLDSDTEGTILAALRDRGAPVSTDGAPSAEGVEGAHGEVIGLPTVYHKNLNGAVMLCRDAEDGPWDDEERELATDVAGQLAAAFEQIETNAKLRDLSRTDELTGLLNRRAFHADLKERLDRKSRSGTGCAQGALLFVDLDNFKLVNDVHGHARGDEALVAVSTLLRSKTRPGDLVGRLGGDEFALWLERIDLATAEERARCILGSIDSLSEFSGDPARPLGLSIGIAVHDPAVAAETVTGVTDRADAAMYEIKHGTKGGYIVARPPEAGPEASAKAAGETVQ